MRKRRNKKKTINPIIMPKQTPKDSNIVKRKRRGRIRLFRPFKKKKSTLPKRRGTQENIKYLVIPILSLLVLFIIYGAIRYVLFLKGNISKPDNQEISKVLGLEDIPTFPGSQFLFLNNKDDSVVKDFLSQGNSAYKIPDSKGFIDVEEYYTDVLKELDWELVQNVPLGSPDKKHGIYWVKENKGLRIYSKHKDIWYESITVSDATSALSHQVAEEIERDMLMASSEKQSLLPDYPWKIEVPKEYIIKYSPSKLKELRAVSFQKLGGSDTVELFPIGQWKSKEMDYFLNDYCKIKEENELQCGVINSIPISFKDTLGLQSTLQIEDETYEAYAIANTHNYIVYILISNTQNNPLLDYIINNIKTIDEKD